MSSSSDFVEFQLYIRFTLDDPDNRKHLMQQAEQCVFTVKDVVLKIKICLVRVLLNFLIRMPKYYIYIYIYTVLEKNQCEIKKTKCCFQT